MIDTNDVQVFTSASAGIGSWYLPLSQGLQIGISAASLIFITLKIVQLIKNGKSK